MNRSMSPYVSLSTAEPRVDLEMPPFESLTPRPTEGESNGEIRPRNGQATPATSLTALPQLTQPFAPLHSEMTTLGPAGQQLMEELAAAKGKLDALERERKIHQQEIEIAVAHAASTELGLFILHKIAEAGEGVPLGEVDANLQGPEGWLAVARLMKAGLVDENGRTLYSTSAGEQVLEDIGKRLG